MNWQRTSFNLMYHKIKMKYKPPHTIGTNNNETITLERAVKRNLL